MIVTATMIRHGLLCAFAGLLMVRLFRTSSGSDSLPERRLPTERDTARVPKWNDMHHPSGSKAKGKKNGHNSHYHPKAQHHDPWEPNPWYDPHPWYDPEPWQPCIPPDSQDSKKGRHNRKGSLKDYDPKELEFEEHVWGHSKEWAKYRKNDYKWRYERGKTTKRTKTKGSKSMKGSKSSKSSGYKPKYKGYKPKYKPKPCPTKEPTKEPTDQPSSAPSSFPSMVPTATPSFSPTMTPSVSPSATPTASPSLSPTESPTESPTIPPTMEPLSGSRDYEPFSDYQNPPKNPATGDYVVEITPFAVQFKVTETKQLTEKDLKNIERLTTRLLDNYFHSVFVRQSGAILKSVDVAVRQDEPPQVQSSMIKVNFEVKAVFDGDSDAVPTVGEMDMHVQDAFWGDSLDRFQEELESLPKSSVFASAIVYSVSTDSSQRSTSTQATKSSSSLVPPTMVVAIVSFTTFVMGAFFFVLFRQKAMKDKRRRLFQNEFPVKDDGHSIAEVTMADEDSLQQCEQGDSKNGGLSKTMAIVLLK